MPEAPLTPDRRRIVIDPDMVDPPQRAAFVELGVASCFSFLRGASDAAQLVERAWKLGYDAIGIADVNSMAGVVRVHTEVQKVKLRAVIGCRIETVEGLTFLAYPEERTAYGRLCRLISAGRMGTLLGTWQEKGVCEISLKMLVAHSEGVHLVLVPPRDLDTRYQIALQSNVVAFPLGKDAARSEHDPGEEHIAVLPFAQVLPHLVSRLPTMRHIAACYLYVGDDLGRIGMLDTLARENGLTILATNDVLYHEPERRPLQDVMTAIRHKTTVAQAGRLLEPNAERHLKSPQEMVTLFARWPHAISAARVLANAATFDLKTLEYEYPEEICPGGLEPQAHLEKLTWEGAARRYPAGVPHTVAETVAKELALIGKMKLARYFLTIKDIVDFARNCDPPILCQGRGSAANSAACYCLEITSVDPAEHSLLFERFISEDRNEPPDIDVDFEHERREEVIQYIYKRYGRHRAGLCATVIHYRPRMAIREVGKVMGLTEDVTAALARTVWGGWGKEIGKKHVSETGMDTTDPHLRRVLNITANSLACLDILASMWVASSSRKDRWSTRSRSATAQCRSAASLNGTRTTSTSWES